MKFSTHLDYYAKRFLMFIVDEWANERERMNEDVIRMTLGKSELPLHPDIVKVMQNSLSDFKRANLVFPSGLPELKDKLSELYSVKYKVECPAERIIVSVGTSTLFRNLFHLLVGKGDEVLLPKPYYPLYHFSALLRDAAIRYYSIDINTLRLDIKSLKKNFTTKTRLVVINSPGNPIGNILTEQELRNIDEIVNGSAVIISDEIYGNMCFDEPSISIMQLPRKKSTFILTNSFSKGYRMYSRRVGYCIVPAELIEPLTVIQHHTLLTTDPVVQYGALEALKYPEEVTHLVELYRQRRDYTLQKFKRIDSIRVLPAKGSFYITLDCKSYMNNRGIVDALDLAKRIFDSTRVAIVPGSDFGLPFSLRLSYCTSRFNEGIDRLIGFFST